MRLTTPPTPPLSGGFGYPLGTVAATAVTLLAVAAGATTHPPTALVALTVTTAATAAVTTLRAALATAAVCWALYTGFVLNRYGVLGVNDQSAYAAVLLAAAALIVFAVTVTVRSRAIKAGGRAGLEDDNVSI